MRTLIAYDGSPEGQGLLGAIPALFPASTARVLTIYEGPLEMEIALASAGGVGYVGLDDEAWESFERTSREDAMATAQEAVAALLAAGLTADAAAERSRAGANTVSRILETAEDWDADVIATGTRGRGGVKRALLGLHVDGTPAPRGCGRCSSCHARLRRGTARPSSPTTARRQRAPRSG